MAVLKLFYLLPLQDLCTRLTQVTVKIVTATYGETLEKLLTYDRAKPLKPKSYKRYKLQTPVD